MGTSVATGTGVAEVIATGMATELGKIAKLLATAEDTTTPLQPRLARVSHVLLLLCLGIVVVTAAVGLAARAVVPGSVHVGGVARGRGRSRGAAGDRDDRARDRRPAHGRSATCSIRRLPAVETLGCATVICTDKTGTLTTGVMTVRELWGADHRALLDAAAACCDAELADDARTGTGDPTEIALLAAAAERGHRPAHDSSATGRAGTRRRSTASASACPSPAPTASSTSRARPS